MKSNIKKFFALLLSLCMIMTMFTFNVVSAAEESEETNGSAMSQLAETLATSSDVQLYAGEGKATMIFPQEYFDIRDESGNLTGYEDGFNGTVYEFASDYGTIVDNLCTRVLLVGGTEKIAIVALEVAQAPDDQVTYTKEIVSEICDVEPENVWVHTTHQFGFMHRPSDETKAATYDTICKAAVKEAAQQAVESYQPAVYGVGTGNSYVSANKNIINPNAPGTGPYYGPGSTLETDPTVTIIRFQSAETGKDIGFFMSYGTKPSALCTTGKTVGNRQVNTEVTGQACKLMEAEYGVPCMFCMPAAGDQYPRETAQYYGVKEDGTWGLIDIGFDEGIKIVVKLGAELGKDAIGIAKDIKCTETNANVSIAATTFDYENKAGTGTITVNCDLLTIGDIAFVGFKQEMDCVTGQQIQKASPYKTTLLVSFLNGDGKYFGHKEAYEFNNGVGTWETSKSAFAVGAAEKFVEVASDLTNKMYNGEIESGYGIDYASSKLRVGAGEATMIFPQEYFEIRDEQGNLTGYEDGFNGSVYTFESEYGTIVDNLCTRVLLLEDETRVAIVSLEVAQAPTDQVEYTKEIVSEICDVDPENVWVHTTHQFGFMHRPSDETKAATYDSICKEAVKEAATQAMETFQPAVLGVGTGDSYVSANKNITDPSNPGAGPYYGPGSTLETDTTVTILRFQSAETGKDIGFYMSYGTKPSALCTTGKTVGNRQVNTEVTGQACKLVEAEYGAPCMFCMPAAGDQYPRETAQYYGVKEDGTWGLIDIGFEEGIKIVKKLGAELGKDAKNIIAGITCTTDDADIEIAATSFDYANKAETGTVNITCDVLTLGDIAFVGFKQEMDCVTGQQIQEASPYKTTLMVSFLNGDGKYFGHKEAYDYNNGTGTWETSKSAYAVGAAEKFVSVASDLLNGLKDGSIENGYGKEYQKKKQESLFAEIEFAGSTWYVLDKKDDKFLIMSKEVIGSEEYNSDNGAVTWETSDLRAYLNGEYYDSLNSSAQSRIVETTNVNKSNSQYGIDGGNDTVDKVFVLSADEAALYLEGFADVMIGKDSSGNATWYWLRTPGEATNTAARVTSLGAIDLHGVSDTLTAVSGGVRPCMWISTEGTLLDTVTSGTSIYENEEVAEIFDGENVEEAIEAIMNAGDVYVNGKALPKSETDSDALSETDARGDSVKGFAINGLVSFYNSTGAADGWIQTVHKATSQATTFTAARKGFLNGISQMTGLDINFYDTDADGKCDSITTNVKEVLRVDSFTQAADGTVKISRGNFTLGNRAGSLEINDIASFSKENWDESIAAGDMIYYWEEGTEWHAEKADYITGLLTDGADHSYYIFNGEKYTDCNTTKYYLITGNRPGQFLGAHLYLGLTDEEVNMWTIGAGYPFGYTSVDPEGSLAKAISNVEARLDSAVVSADGSGVVAGKYYVTSAADGNAVEAAVVAAQKVLGDEKSSAADLDLAIYNLYNTIKDKLVEGSATFSDITGCSAGVQKAINWAADNGIVNGVGDNKFDPYSYCTRAQMAVMLYRLAGKPDVTTEAVAAAKEKFSDVASLSWGVLKAVAWAVSEGIINGYKDGTFRPEESISRASTVVMLWRMAGKPEVRAAATFTDTASCSAGVMKAINWAASVGITKGSSNGDGTYSFCPEDACQRQHIATFVYRYANLDE